MRLNEHQFRSLIATIMVEELKKLMYPKPNKVVFMLGQSLHPKGWSLSKED